MSEIPGSLVCVNMLKFLTPCLSECSQISDPLSKQMFSDF